MMSERKMKLKGFRCPECGKKGLHHPMRAQGYKYEDYGKVQCRFCKKRFKTEFIEKYIDSLYEKYSGIKQEDE